MRRSWSKIGPGWSAVAASFYDKCIIALVQNFQLTRKTKLRLELCNYYDFAIHSPLISAMALAQAIREKRRKLLLRGDGLRNFYRNYLGFLCGCVVFVRVLVFFFLLPAIISSCIALLHSSPHYYYYYFLRKASSLRLTEIFSTN